MWERNPAEMLPAGYNLLFNHNHVGALVDADAELGAAVQAAGTPFKKWINKTFEGETSLDMDVHAAGLTGDTEWGSILRWDIVCEVLRKACHDVIEYEAQVSHHSYVSGGGVMVEVGDVQREVDLLVISDGRYSKMRELAVGGQTKHSLGVGMANFRLVYENDGSIPELTEHVRLYNFPDESRLQPGGDFAHLSAASGADPSFEHVCMAGHARLGIMPLRSRSGRVDRYAAYGNFRFNGEIPKEAKTADGLLAMYQPRGGGKADALGQFVLDGLVAHADEIYWARMQRNPTHYRDVKGGVLLIGDAASGFFPSLGQGAGQAIEDACAAANVLLGAVEASQRRGGGVDIAACTALVERVRRERRDFVADLSDTHTTHMVEGGRKALETFEQDEWMAANGRASLERLWAGFPRATQAFEAGYAVGIGSG